MSSSAAATSENYTLSLHDALPIWICSSFTCSGKWCSCRCTSSSVSGAMTAASRSEEHTSELQSLRHLVCRLLLRRPAKTTLFPYTTLFRSGSVPLLRVLGSGARADVLPHRYLGP